MFQEELDYFKANQSDLVRQYQGKILVIKGKQIVGAYDRTIDAYNEAIKQFKPGSFMIQPCEPGPEAYTVTISSSELLLR
jgi:hypothetical protein